MRIDKHIRKNYLEYTIIVSLLFIFMMSSTQYRDLELNPDVNKLPFTGSFLAVQHGSSETCEDLQEVKASLDLCDSRLSICQNTYRDLYSNNTKLLSDFNDISARLSNADSNLEEITSKFDDSSKTAKFCISELDELRISLNEIVENAANNICCKKRVDDSSINSYSIENNNIVCSSSGTHAISCSV